MNFDETSLEQATAFHEYFLSVRDIRLRDLAWAMKDSPEIGLMDGSLESLVPLWIWARQHAAAGLPSVSRFDRPASAIFLGAPPDKMDRYNVLGETIERYVLEAALAARPQLVWAIGIRSFPDDWRHHRTTLRIPNGGFFGSSGMGKQLWLHAQHLVRKRDDMIFLTVTMDYHDGVSVPTGPSILTPFLDLPPLAWDDPARIPPIASEIGLGTPVTLAGPELAEPQSGESELIFAAIGTDVEDLAHARPLDEPAIAAVLAELGFEARFLEDALRVSETQLLHPSSAILVEVFAHRDRLRGLHFELHGPEQENLAVVAAFTSLGHRLRARLGSEDDWASGL